MTDDILHILQEEILDEPGPLTSESDLFELGLDSMAIMQLQLALEDRFQIAIDPADLSRDNFQTPARIAALVRTKS